jgi:ATP-dependent Zn protease
MITTASRLSLRRIALRQMAMLRDKSDAAIEVKKKNFTTKITKTTKKEQKPSFVQVFATLYLFVLFVSSWFYFLEDYSWVQISLPH